MVSSLSNSGGVGGGGGDVCAPGISRGAGNVKDTEWGNEGQKQRGESNQQTGSQMSAWVLRSPVVTGLEPCTHLSQEASRDTQVNTGRFQTGIN
jgi:hypothetical protein